MLRNAALACALVAAALTLAPHAAAAAPGDSLAAERARLAGDRDLTPLAKADGDATRYVTGPPVPPDTAPGGRDGWQLTLIVKGATVTDDVLTVTTPGRPYDAFTDGRALAARVFTTPVAADLAASAIVARQQQDPDIAQVFRRGTRFAYRVVDDRRNAIHSIDVMPLAALAASMHDFGLSPLPAASVSSARDIIYAVGATGQLSPVAVRVQGVFQPVTAEPALTRVHLIFGNRTIATLATSAQYGRPHVAVPASLPLDGRVNALASPTLGAHAAHARRAPTPAERATALQLAAARLHARAAHLEVRALTAIDLGHGMALAGTVNLRGTGSPRVDRRLFFVAETNGGAWTLTLAGLQTITVSEPLLEEPAEYLIDALDLGNGQTGIVTRIIGYDAASYAIYARTSATTWKPVFAGGGAAN